MICFNNRVEGCSASETTMFARTDPTAKNRSAVAQMYLSPTSSRSIFCTINVATYHSNHNYTVIKVSKNLTHTNKRMYIFSQLLSQTNFV